MDVNIHEAKTHLSRLLTQIHDEEVFINRAGKRIAQLVPIEEKIKGKRVPGTAKGKIWMSEDFDAPLPDEVLNSFYENDEEMSRVFRESRKKYKRKS